MSSITCWNRLEPRSKSYSIEEGLAAKIRDPLWMLARQWQFGEFHGEDAGSPAHVEISATTTEMLGPLRNGMISDENGMNIPIEMQIEDETFTADDSIKVELGQTFEALLTQRLAAANILKTRITKVINLFRNAYPLEDRKEEELQKMADQEDAKFLRVCLKRCINGIKLYEEAVSKLPSLPPKPVLEPLYQDPVKAALEDLVLWVREIFRGLGFKDPSDWQPERLEYSSNVAAADAAGSPIVLSAKPNGSGDLDWYCFELKGKNQNGAVPPPAISTLEAKIVPAHVKFRGMPNPRWWDFERGTTDFGDIRPDKLDIARLVVMEFMLVHGIDWFVLPLEQKVGTLCKVNSLKVRDVFGGMTQIERADAAMSAGKGGWTIFSTAWQDEAKVADFFLLSPSVAIAKQLGPVIEDVRFLRDEAANMAWGVEHSTEDGLGQPWSGHERSLAARALRLAGKGSSEEFTAPLRYLIQTTVPENWIPLIPVSTDAAKGKFMLQKSQLIEDAIGDNDGDPLIRSIGRVLHPNLPTGEDLYRIFEEEVPRSGARVYRELCRSRWTDGSTHIWINRRKAAGTGEGSSGLAFDQALRNKN